MYLCIFGNLWENCLIWFDVDSKQPEPASQGEGLTLVQTDRQSDVRMYGWNFFPVFNRTLSPNGSGAQKANHRNFHQCCRHPVSSFIGPCYEWRINETTIITCWIFGSHISVVYLPSPHWFEAIRIDALSSLWIQSNPTITDFKGLTIWFRCKRIFVIAYVWNKQKFC